MGVIFYHRQPFAKSTLKAKATFGVVLAISALAFGLVVQLLLTPFTFVEISIPFAVLGSFVFPFVLFDTMWNALSKANTATESKDT